MNALARLQDIGFVCVGNWTLDATSRLLPCNLTLHAKATNILYAFVCESEVLYIGKTVRSLHSRLRGYAVPGPTQSTNIRGHARLCELLGAGKTVEVYALPDNGLIRYGGFHLNLAAGLEDSLIRELKPKWNLSGLPVA